MNKLLIVPALVIGLVIGMLSKDLLRSDGDGDLGAETDAKIRALQDELSAADRKLGAERARIAKLEEERDQAQKALGEFRGSADGDREKLDARIAALDRENAELQAKVQELADKRNSRIEDIVARIDKLKGQGLQSLIASGQIGSIVADLKAIGEGGTKAVLDMLASTDSQDRLMATMLLMQMDEPGSVDALKSTILGDADEMVATMASQALMRMDNDKAVAALTEAVEKSPYEGARVNSMFGLCRHGDAKGIEMTAAYMENKENPAAMRGALLQSVFLLTNKESMPLYDVVAKDDDMIRSERATTRMIEYWKGVHDDAARQRIQGFVANPQVPAAAKTAAQKALADW